MQTGGDAGLEVRLPVDGGPHVVGVAFVRELWEPEGLPHPPQRGRTITNDNVYMGYANVGEVQIGGPSHQARQPGGAGRRVHLPPAQPRATERACARQILSRIARQAYRRPVTNADVDTLLEFFDSGRRDGGSFDAGVQLALERVLVDPDFLLRVHRARAGDSGPVRAGVAAVVLPVEQHPRRTAARPGRTGTPGRSRRAGARGAAHAGRPPRRRAGHGLRRAVAEPAAAARGGRRSRPLSHL